MQGRGQSGFVDFEENRIVQALGRRVRLNFKIILRAAVRINPKKRGVLITGAGVSLKRTGLEQDFRAQSQHSLLRGKAVDPGVFWVCVGQFAGGDNRQKGYQIVEDFVEFHIEAQGGCT